MKTLFRLLRAWMNGRYRVVPWRTLLYLAVATVYAVSPVDIIPDAIPFFGVIDDAAILGLVVRSLLKDARKFADWEAGQGR